jgi:hypothetical protein
LPLKKIVKDLAIAQLEIKVVGTGFLTLYIP